MPFSIVELMETQKRDQYALHRQYINPGLAQVQTIIGFDKIYVRGEGAYLWDADGNRYLDLLSGFGVFNLGRSHPVVKQVIHDVLACLDHVKSLAWLTLGLGDVHHRRKIRLSTKAHRDQPVDVLWVTAFLVAKTAV